MEKIHKKEYGMAKSKRCKYCQSKTINKFIDKREIKIEREQ
jgi:hypothetical protein